MDDKTRTYTCPSIFGLLTNHQLNWAIYGYNAEPLTRLNFPDTTNAPDSHFGQFADFQKAAAAGTLPRLQRRSIRADLQAAVVDRSRNPLQRSFCVSTIE
jgi:hypothetical protein